ncbi:MAG: SDR family NAD(P)-dependent oxidoreductase, partial [Alphaproteobacteria bacterium]|nr:SDR family NAD(P)-dependent oxidoreductase [Alphaproteobacteria bacterium]
MKLANKVAVVTGGARGIGRGIAERFKAEGCRVMIGDIDGDGAAATAKAIGEGCAALTTDVSTQAGAQALVDAAVERFGRLDICVNNAAIVRLGLL